MNVFARNWKYMLAGALSAAFVCVLVPLGIRLYVARYVSTQLSTLPYTQVAIIPGASVRAGAPSPVLAERANAAIELYFSGKVSKILVTGDNGQLSHDEVTPVRKYLLNAGVPSQDIFLDHAGFDTYSSMYRARDVFKATSVTIVTQDFHLPRALYIARRLGLNAYGFVADGSGTSPYDYIREIPASDKVIFDLAFKREPKYLGDPFLLTGDGRTTWY